MEKGAEVYAKAQTFGRLIVNAGEHWRDLNSSRAKAFNDLVRNSSLPTLKGREVIIATDTSGLHQQSRFEVLGIVIFDFDSSTQWKSFAN